MVIGKKDKEMISKLFLLNFITLFHIHTISSMYKRTPSLGIKATKNLIITHIRNFQHHLTYKTPEGIIVKEHWDGSETHTYPDGKVIHQFPKEPTNQTAQKKNELNVNTNIQKLKR